MTGGVAPGSGDRGLQAERTFMAYGRTQLVAVVAALLVAHDAHTGGRHAFAVVIAVAAVLVICVAGGLRQRRLLRPSGPADGNAPHDRRDHRRRRAAAGDGDAGGAVAGPGTTDSGAG